MRYAVIYQSKSGNTRLLAEQIYETLNTEEKEIIDIDITTEIPDADVYFVGFGIHNRFCSMDVLDTLEQISGGQIALFATCGYLPTEQYKVNLETHMEAWLPEDADYLGMFLCQGTVEMDRRKIMIGQMPSKEKELEHMFELGSVHPDQEDITSITDFAIDIQTQVEYGERSRY